MSLVSNIDALAAAAAAAIQDDRDRITILEAAPPGGGGIVVTDSVLVDMVDVGDLFDETPDEGVTLELVTIAAAAITTLF